MKIDVSTGSRLHFGLICGTQRTGWRFGGIGVMLRQPCWQLSLQLKNSGHDCIIGSDEATLRVIDFLKQIRTGTTLPPLAITINAEIPFHTGLGSGTQLGLALAAAAELAVTIHASHDPYHLALLAHRAERSAIGTIGFRDGGFLIDHGLPDNASELRQVDRISVPEAWRFILVRPTQSQGLSGDRERSFFSRKILMPELLVEKLAETIALQLIPSVRDQGFEDFAMGLESYGNAVGQFYATEQGDIFAHAAMRQLVDQLLSRGIHGAAQSSWGPGICIPARSISHARSIEQFIPSAIGDTALSVNISEPQNVGASIRTISPESRSESIG